MLASVKNRKKTDKKDDFEKRDEILCSLPPRLYKVLQKYNSTANAQDLIKKRKSGRFAYNSPDFLLLYFTEQSKTVPYIFCA